MTFLGADIVIDNKNKKSKERQDYTFLDPKEFSSPAPAVSNKSENQFTFLKPEDLSFPAENTTPQNALTPPSLEEKKVSTMIDQQEPSFRSQWKKVGERGKETLEDVKDFGTTLWADLNKRSERGSEQSKRIKKSDMLLTDKIMSEASNTVLQRGGGVAVDLLGNAFITAGKVALSDKQEKAVADYFREKVAEPISKSELYNRVNSWYENLEPTEKARAQEAGVGLELIAEVATLGAIKPAAKIVKKGAEATKQLAKSEKAKSLGESLENSAIKQYDDEAKDIVTERLDEISQKERRKNARNVKEGFFGKRELREQDPAAIQEASLLVQQGKLNKKQSTIKQIGAFEEAIGNEATKLSQILQNSGATYSKKQLAKYMADDLKILKLSPTLVGNAEKSVEKIVKGFSAIVDKKGNDVSDLLQARKEFDTWLTQNRVDLSSISDTGTANNLAIKGIRNAINDFINQQVGSDIVRKSLAKQSALYRGLAVIENRFAREPATLFARAIDRVSKTLQFPKTEIIETIGLVSLVGFAGATSGLAGAAVALGGGKAAISFVNKGIRKLKLEAGRKLQGKAKKKAMDDIDELSKAIVAVRKSKASPEDIKERLYDQPQKSETPPPSESQVKGNIQQQILRERKQSAVKQKNQPMAVAPQKNPLDPKVIEAASFREAQRYLDMPLGEFSPKSLKALADLLGEELTPKDIAQLKKELGGSIYDKKLSELIEMKGGIGKDKSEVSNTQLATKSLVSTYTNGGFTYKPDGTPIKEGFAFSPYKDREFSIEKRNVTIETLNEYYKKNKDLATVKENNFGGWIEGDRLYLDVSKVYKDEKTAIVEAVKNNQEAIYDLKNDKTIYTKQKKNSSTNSSGVGENEPRGKTGGSTEPKKPLKKTEKGKIAAYHIENGVKSASELMRKMPELTKEQVYKLFLQLEGIKVAKKREAIVEMADDSDFVLHSTLFSVEGSPKARSGGINKFNPTDKDIILRYAKENDIFDIEQAKKEVNIDEARKKLKEIKNRYQQNKYQREKEGNKFQERYELEKKELLNKYGKESYELYKSFNDEFPDYFEWINQDINSPVKKFLEKLMKVDTSNATYSQGGYSGFSQSNRALSAKSGGILPKSHFEKEYNLPKGFIDKMKIKTKEYHHTSKKYNSTDFFNPKETAQQLIENFDSPKKLEEEIIKNFPRFFKNSVKVASKETKKSPNSES